MTNREKCEKWLCILNTHKCAWMKKTFPEIDRCAKADHACKEIPKIIAEKTSRKEKEVRNIRNAFHYTIKLQEPILKVLKSEGKGLRPEEVWDRIGIGEPFLCEKKKIFFVALTRALLSMLEVEGCVKSYEQSNGVVWKFTDKEIQS